MAGVYCQRHPERTVLYRVLFHYFERFLGEYEHRFEKEYGYLRPIIQDVVNKYLDCGNPKNGFARIKCKDCGLERLLMFSCHGRGFCPSCHAKRREEWGEWMREGCFHRISRFNDDLLREIFTREVFSLLLHKQLINLTLIQKILRWRHTGFHVHSQVRATRSSITSN
jgi:hypothetical protein